MELQTFQVGAVLSRGFGIWLKNFIPFTLLALLFNLPLFVYTHVTFANVDDANIFQFLDDLRTWTILVYCGGLLAAILLSGTLTYGVFEQLRGRHASIGKCLAVGLSRFLPALVVTILVVLAILLGLLLLVVPGVILACVLWVALPVAVVERPGISGALSRSAELTAGYRGQIFLVLLVVWFINLASGQIVESMAGGIENLDDFYILQLVALGIQTLVFTLAAVLTAVGYHDLRATKEGVDVEELARVFD